MPTESRTRAGGAATAGGMNFQHRLTAFVGVQILAERGATPLWDLSGSLELVRCETDQPVDDLLVVTANRHVAFAQAKRDLKLSGNPQSELAAVLNQFVRQFLLSRSATIVDHPWLRSLDPAHDRLVMVVGTGSSSLIRERLPAVLNRVRTLPSGLSIESAAGNAEERRAIDIVLDHIRRLWQIETGTLPNEGELHQLLSLIRISVLNLDEGGHTETEAKNLLRGAVLRNADQADAAWATLISQSASFAQNRTGASRIELQQKLLDAGFDLNAAASYRDDIARLQDYSAVTLELLSDLAQIQAGTVTIKILRPAVQALEQAAQDGSLLIIGEPGAGKSGVLYNLARDSERSGRHVVVIVADRLGARSLSELRNELDLDNELIDVLSNWPGRDPALLIIDGLDAVRADPSGQVLREFIKLVFREAPRWRVVASIRKFDLRYSHELQQLFDEVQLGELPLELRDSDFAGTRHLNVMRLSDHELDQVAQQSAQLASLFNTSPVHLRELLRVPFNLRIAAELLETDRDLPDFASLRTQSQLLDRYWSRRVIGNDHQSDAREYVLRRVCEEMVRARRLRVERGAVADASTSAALGSLLSAHVLTEWRPSANKPPERYVLNFSHHTLFDYAAARLLLRGESYTVVNRHREDPEIALVIRPSLLFHFQYLWTDRGPESFWDEVFRVQKEREIPEIGKLVGPQIAAEMTTRMLELEQLCAACESTAQEERDTGLQALRHMIGSLLASDSRLTGPGAGPWGALSDRLSRNLWKDMAHTLRVLLSKICEDPTSLTPDQLAAAGKTARRLLLFAWGDEPRSSFLVGASVEAVCRTFESDRSESAALIRRWLEPNYLSAHGYAELPRLAREVKRLVSVDPLLVEEIYRAAFRYMEASDASTTIGSSAILSMTSTRRQDYNMGLHMLEEVYPTFLIEAPISATRALIAVLDAYVAQQYPHWGDEPAESFDFDGRQAHIRTDYSSIWDERAYRHDSPLKMLDNFITYLRGLAADDLRAEQLRDIVDLLVRENSLAVFWRRLLIVGAHYTSTLGREILPLSWSIPVLTYPDTRKEAGDFINAVFPALSLAERGRIEQAIFRIPGSFPERREGAERLRNRLLGCLPFADLTTAEARGLIQSLQAENAIPANEPDFRFESSSAPFGEEEFLTESGVPVNAPPNRQIRDLERPVAEFANQHLNSVPSPVQVSAVLHHVERLHEALRRADNEGVHPMQRDHAWSTLADACETCAKLVSRAGVQPWGLIVRDILLEASTNPEPQHDPSRDAQFDRSPSWSLGARIRAARGVTLMARERNYATPAVLAAIDRLSQDPVPAVRFQVSTTIISLHDSAPELMWQIIERAARSEPSRGVQQGLVSVTLGPLAGNYPDRVFNLVSNLLERTVDGEGASKVRDDCISIVNGLFVWRGHQGAGETVSRILNDPATNATLIHRILTNLRRPLTHGAVDGATDADNVRRRAFDMVGRIFRSAQQARVELENAHRGLPTEGWSEADVERWRNLSRTIDNIGDEMYFASGAYHARHDDSQNVQSLAIEVRSRFYREAGPILDDLAEVGHPSLVHKLVETLESFIAFDPKGVFVRLVRSIQRGERWGYQYESLAVDIIVRIVERYLAEYRDLLQLDQDCRRGLIEVLNIFVRANWPQARQLTYRLDEIFR